MNEHDPQTPHGSEEDAEWLKSLGDAGLEPVGAWTEPVVGPILPPLDRERPVRPPVVPRWVWVALAVVVASVVLVGGIAVAVMTTSRVSVVDVEGLQLGVARTRLAQDGLEITVKEERFSPAPRDEILEQSPAAGESIRRGQAVEVVVSAGTEDFTMPDVVGDGLTLARGTLEGAGLVVVVEPVTSDESSDTVLSTDPAPRATVRTGDKVRLRVASPSVGSATVRPFKLQGLSVTLDPAPVKTGTTDVTMSVTRRLRSLLEASGASVTILRSALDTSTTDAARASRATESSATIALGFSVTAKGPEGRAVLYPAAGNAGIRASSAELASAIATALARVAPPVSSKGIATDTVLPSAAAPWVRVNLGSASQRNDRTAWADPTWADRVARALYAAVGSLYGAPEEP